MRKPSGLDLGNFGKPAERVQKSRKSVPANEIKAVAQEIAHQEGFTTRQPVKKIDGRTLRRTNRKAQLNMAVNVTTKDRFWSKAHERDFKVGEDFLNHLLDLLD